MDIETIRADFAILSREIRPGIPLTYLDSTATSQKPRQVIEAMEDYYRLHNANIHRGIHMLAEEATALYESARTRVGKFVGVSNPKEIIFTRNTTESINLVSQSWGRSNLLAGDLVLLTEMEHHSNIVPWQMLASELDLRVVYVPVLDSGDLDLAAYESLLLQEPKLVSFVHMSNVLGTINPAKEMIKKAHAAGAITLVDAAQSVPHFPVDVIELGADFFAFSAHKMCGPTGVGVLYGREKLLHEMPPFLGGGDMIKRVRFDGFSPNDLPHKFEAGTPAIAEAIGFGAAVDYLASVGMDWIAQHEHELTEYALERLEEIPGVWVFGSRAGERGGVTSFTVDDIHAHDVSQILDHYGVAVRAGHHCAMPLHEKFGLSATARASFYLYNRRDEIDRLVDAIYAVKKIFA